MDTTSPPLELLDPPPELPELELLEPPVWGDSLDPPPPPQPDNASTTENSKVKRFREKSPCFMGNPVINVKYSQRSLRAAITGAPEQPDYSDGEAPQKIAIKAKTVIDASPERVMKCNFVRADHKKYKTNNKKTQELVKPQYE